MNKSQAIATLRQLVAEVMQEHRDPECAAYNECDQPGQACMWCSMAQKALDATEHTCPYYAKEEKTNDAG